MKSFILWSESSVFERLETALSSDKLAITTTDTVLGLLACCNQKSFEALNACKGRFEKPYLVLARDVQIAKKYVDPLSYSLLEQLAASFWPGPLTIILPAAADAPSYMRSAHGTIALRVPDHAGLQTLLAKHEVLFSTSANKAGEPVPVSVDQLDPAIVEGVECVVHDRADLEHSIPSTIIDCTRLPITLVRQGAVSRAALESVAPIGVVE